ncbi:MAG: translocation protein TolB [Deltaproteobacteria bacterium]|jgi:TolB protein|nr:translocation protein TolB [Deltaproteobacteria bacterium]
MIRNFKIKLPILLMLALGLVLSAAALPLHSALAAQDAPSAQGAPSAQAAQTGLKGRYIAPISPSAYLVQAALADPLGESRYLNELQAEIRNNLGFLPFLRLIDARAVPGGLKLPTASEPGLDFERFRLTRTDNLITSIWINSNQVELRAFDVSNGKFMFGSRFDVESTKQVEEVADEFCAMFMQALTGRGDFFRSSLAFSKSDGPRKRDIWTVRPTGGNLTRRTNIPGDAISPTWSHDGRFIVFSHIDDRSHALGVWDADTNRVQRLRFPGNTVIGPCFMPDNKVAVSLTDGRNPSIFLLDHSFKKEKTLINSWAIDVSPSVDASGNYLAYTSSRQGNPHIFLTNLKTGQTARISSGGKYNTDPSISPDGTLVVFARQMGGGHRIFLHDLRNGAEKQLTFGPGSDEQPEFAPDSYFIAFTSTRSGSKKIYLTTRHGGEPRQIDTGSGEASFPTWGIPRK